MAAVKLVSLTKEYQNGENYIRAVDDVSFSIKEGEFIAVIGASGSGKSTLINLISGLEKPTHGCVYVHDVNLTQLSLEEQISFRRWHIGVVFQKYNLIPAMNVFENIVLPAKLLERTVNEKEVFHLAKTLGIEEKLFQMPDELSGGQQQRAAIARAVYTHPTILLGDELTGNLDSRTSASVMELLKKISRQYQQTMLVVTHDEKIAAMADRIIRMKDGRVVKDERLGLSPSGRKSAFGFLSKAEPEQKPPFVSGSCTYRWSDFLYDKFCLWEDPGGHPETYPDRWNDGVNVS